MFNIETLHNIPSRPLNSMTRKNSVLDLYSMKELPDSYEWTPYEDPNPIDTTSHKSIPIIDLDNPNAQALIGIACKSWGVFQVTNHGIQKKLLDNIESTCKSLFALPAQQKLKVARSPNGVTGYGPALISTFFKKKMWSEGFTIFGSPLEHARQLWPIDYGHFCEIVEEYQNKMNDLASKLMHLILGSLGIMSHEHINLSTSSTTTKSADNNIFQGNGAIRLNSYPICPDPNRAMGLATHTDSTLLTILYQTNTSGLQVYQAEFGWVTVQPLQNGLVINMGDLMQILSNGLYPSAYHRAMVNKTRHRYSVAYLYGPPFKTRVEPISKLIDATHPPLYKGVTWSEYLRLKAKYFHKALLLVRLINENENNGINIVNEPESINVDFESKFLAATA